MKLASVLLMVLICNTTFAQHAEHKQHSMESSSKKQTQCPIMGGAINKEVYVDYKGKRIFFAGKMCRDEFNKFPEKYMEKISKEGIILEDAPKS